MRRQYNVAESKAGMRQIRVGSLPHYYYLCSRKQVIRLLKTSASSSLIKEESNISSHFIGPKSELNMISKIPAYCLAPSTQYMLPVMVTANNKLLFSKQLMIHQEAIYFQMLIFLNRHIILTFKNPKS